MSKDEKEELIEETKKRLQHYQGEGNSEYYYPDYTIRILEELLEDK